MRLPFLGRLRVWEWPALFLSLLLVSLEGVLSWVTFFLPSSVILMFEKLAESVFYMMPHDESVKDPEQMKLIRKVIESPGFVELCEIFGYQAEEHIVKTTDGYLLGIHRIGGPKGSKWRGLESNKPVIYLHHGLLMNSEIWICNLDTKKSLPFVLAELGYDVWLGNNRGNKYSKKHIGRHPTDAEFWNFSMDEFALYDIPDTIDYILNVTKQKNVAYVGFSQGSAQAFAALSINPTLNSKVRLFVALAPAMAPPGLKNRIVDSLTKATPQLIYLFFGKNAILKSTALWQSIMFPPMFVKVIDIALDFLFNWQGHNIDSAQKLAAYAHLYSYTSVKSVVHWFQVMRSGRFHMFDDDAQTAILPARQFYKVAPFPTRNIMTPVVLIYGKVDSLVDIRIMLHELPDGTAHVGVPNYEHLDMLWGRSVDTLVFPYVLSALKRADNE